MAVVHVLLTDEVPAVISYINEPVWRVKMCIHRLEAGSGTLDVRMRPMMQWCEQHVGEVDVDWRRFISSILFRHKRDAMLFKLTWHGVQL